MTTQRRPDEEQGGFETSSELRHDYPAPAPSAPPVEERTANAPYASARSRRSIWLLAVAVVVVGLAVYLIVTLL
jgi:hypothetical protein